MTAPITEHDYSEDETKSLIKTIDLEAFDTNLNFLKVLHEVSKYQGFNPRDIIAQLVTLHSKARREFSGALQSVDKMEITVTVAGEERNAIFTNNIDFHEDMQFICLMFITRGAAFDNIQRKTPMK